MCTKLTLKRRFWTDVSENACLDEISVVIRCFSILDLVRKSKTVLFVQNKERGSRWKKRAFT